MIQRIQTVYLFLTVILCATSLFATMGCLYDGTELIAKYNNFVLQSSSTDVIGPWALGLLLVLVLLINLVAIMLFKHLKRQLRLTIFSTILLVGFVLTYVGYAFIYIMRFEAEFPDHHIHFSVPFMAILPLCTIIFNIMAIHGIRKDMALLQSAYRLR